MANQKKQIGEKMINFHDSKKSKKNKEDSSVGGDCRKLIHSITFGKDKSFWWGLRKDDSIYIVRKFNSSKGIMHSKKVVTDMEINKINIFMGNKEWKDLANNVEKLSNGNEQIPFRKIKLVNH